MRLIDADKLKQHYAWWGDVDSTRQMFDAIVDAQPTVEQQAWISVDDELPEEIMPVNIVWTTRKPEPYYDGIRDQWFVATGLYHKGKWYWYSVVCQDYLWEYGKCDFDEIDKDIEILFWTPLPEPPEVEE